MNYHKIDPCSISNGIGIRTVLWVSGCSHHCFNCQNPETHDVNSGRPFDDKAQTELFDYLSKPYIDGITFSGGDPLYDNNLRCICALIVEIRKIFPNKTIWLYTGYTLSDCDFHGVNGMNCNCNEDVYWYQIIKSCDVIVDGDYKDELRDITLQFRGSSNQRLIDVKKTIKVGHIVLWGDTNE